MYYKSYDEAVTASCQATTTLKLHMIDHPDSYNEVLFNGRVVQWVGFGYMKTPGHPSSHQNLKRQQVFMDEYVKQGFVPIFQTFNDGFVKFLGNYTLKSFKKKLSFGGFQYYEYMFAIIPPGK